MACSTPVQMLKGKYWFKQGTHIAHRIDGPAIEFNNGDKHWYVEGKRHRINGPAIEFASGGRQWWVDDRLHRLDGPAIECQNGDHWYSEGKRHRLNGPAIETFQGIKYFCIRGKYVTEQDVQALAIVSKFRQRVHLFHSIIPHLFKLSQLVKSKPFCEWYYHPDQPGGRYAKTQIGAICNHSNKK